MTELIETTTWKITLHDDGEIDEEAVVTPKSNCLEIPDSIPLTQDAKRTGA